MVHDVVSYALICVLTIIVIVLNKKNKKRYYEVEKQISNGENARFVMQQQVNYIEKDIAEKNLIISKKLVSVENEITTLVEEKVGLANDYSKALFKSVTTEVEEQFDVLTAVLEALDEENRKLRQELNEQKKKLNFYANIEESAEKLNVTENTEEREKLVEIAKQQIIERRQKQETDKSAADEEKKEKPDFQEQKEQKIPEVKFNTGKESITKRDGSFMLDEEQTLASIYMDTTTENMLITGKAGTGKSFLLDAFTKATDKSHIVLAPTGIAALNVNGVTLHSTFGYSNLVYLNPDEISAENLKLKPEKRRALHDVKTIIIDEISMVRADTFDKIDRILQVITNSSQPFGGKQILLFGDLFQLPPIAKKEEIDYLMDKYGGIYFFNSNAYKIGNFKFIELTTNHRQKDDQGYFELLNRMREGYITNDDIDLLNTRYTPIEDIYEDRFVSLFPTKAEAEKVNRDHICQIESKEYIYQARTIFDKYPNAKKNIESNFPIVPELRLRRGVSVMMVTNDPGHRWVNGTLGIVERLSESSLFVSFGKNRTYEIHKEEFEEREITYVNGKLNYEPVFIIEQYPLVPAYAITIHKSQGQTYRDIACDINKCFASGQAYVALSRCASLNGLHLKKRISLASIKVDSEVVEFYKAQESKRVF